MNITNWWIISIPVWFLTFLYEMYIDIRNLFIIRSVVISKKNTKEWKDLNLRVDWVYRIYTVVSLRKEDMGNMERVINAMIIEEMMPMNKVLLESGISELLAPEIKKIPDSFSWHIIYHPNIKVLSVANILILFFFSLFSYWAWTRFGIGIMLYEMYELTKNVVFWILYGNPE